MNGMQYHLTVLQPFAARSRLLRVDHAPRKATRPPRKGRPSTARSGSGSIGIWPRTRLETSAPLTRRRSPRGSPASLAHHSAAAATGARQPRRRPTRAISGWAACARSRNRPRRSNGSRRCVRRGDAGPDRGRSREARTRHHRRSPSGCATRRRSAPAPRASARRSTPGSCATCCSCRCRGRTRSPSRGANWRAPTRHSGSRRRATPALPPLPVAETPEAYAALQERALRALPRVRRATGTGHHGAVDGARAARADAGLRAGGHAQLLRADQSPRSRPALDPPLSLVGQLADARGHRMPSPIRRGAAPLQRLDEPRRGHGHGDGGVDDAGGAVRRQPAFARDRLDHARRARRPRPRQPLRAQQRR